jgi:hypothetical protein
LIKRLRMEFVDLTSIDYRGIKRGRRDAYLSAG